MYATNYSSFYLRVSLRVKNKKKYVARSKKRKFDRKKTNIVVQINGKKSSVFETAKDIQQEELLDIIKKDNNLSKYLNGVKIKNVIYIKNKLINIIT